MIHCNKRSNVGARADVFFSKTTVFIIFSILTNCFASLRNWCVHIIFTLSKTCSNNGTTKVWRMSADGNAATCDATCVEKQPFVPGQVGRAFAWQRFFSQLHSQLQAKLKFEAVEKKSRVFSEVVKK